MPKPVSQEFIDNLGRTIEQGLASHRAGRLEEAEKIYGQILKRVPDQFDTLLLMANLQLARGRPAEAQRLAMAAVAARPRSADALVQLGHIRRALKRDDDALKNFDEALAVDPNHIDALGMRGDTLLVRGRAEEALQSFNKILALTPGHVNARISRGVALGMLERNAEALAEFEAVLVLMPQNPSALYNRAKALTSLDRYEESLAAYDRTLACAPNYTLAWNNRGNVLSALNRNTEAIKSFGNAITLAPDFADGYFNQSLSLLATGDYKRGFAEYEWRWKRSGMTRQNYGKPLWLGEYPLARKTILVHSEQGLGDSIQFARYIPILAKAGARVVMEAPAELKSVMSRIAGVSEIVVRGGTLPAYDVHCPLGSLPLAHRTEAGNVPADIPYLVPDEARVAKWRARVEALKRPRVGMVWAGNINHFNDRNRSIAFAQMKPLIDDGAASFVSLQRELRGADADALKQAPAVLHLGDELADLDDTAAIVALCDLVVSVDTSVAHLAAAMGRPTWVLLPFSPDWRWTLDGECSPWYPAARLFRQPQLGDWESVIARVRLELSGFLGK